jgi:hypothetical protein
LKQLQQSKMANFMIAALVVAMLAASADAASLIQCVDPKCSGSTVVLVDDVKLGTCSKGSAGPYYKATASSIDLYMDALCAVSFLTVPVNTPTEIPLAKGNAYLYQDLTGAIVGGIIGGLAFIFLIAMWRFRATKTGPFAEGATFMTWITCKAPHSVVVGAK